MAVALALGKAAWEVWHQTSQPSEHHSSIKSVNLFSYIDFTLCSGSRKPSMSFKTTRELGEKIAQKRKHLMLSLSSKLKIVKQLKSGMDLRIYVTDNIAY